MSNRNAWADSENTNEHRPEILVAKDWSFLKNLKRGIGRTWSEKQMNIYSTSLCGL